MADSPGPIRVLLIDDDEDEYVILRDLLSDTGGAFQLDWVDDPDRAVDAIARCEHDAYLVDYRLGRMDGIEVIRAAIAAGCHQPIILLTGQGGRDVDVQALEAGAADYLTKGRFDGPTLERTLRYAIQQKRLQEELRKNRDELEQRVQERTQNLVDANEELQREIEQRKRIAAALEEADRRKDEFLAILGHELRNPLTPIRVAIQILETQSASEADFERARGIINRQVAQLVRIVNDLMDVSRVTLGKVTLESKSLCLREVLRHAIEAARPLIEERNHRLVAELGGEPLFVHGDGARLQQVFHNLLSNAAKYTEPNGTITVRLERQGDQAVVRVRDTGLGIASEVLPRIFEPYAQADRTITHSEGGIGVGLTLVRRLVEMHGGAVWAKSEGVKRGSEFAVTLPVASPPA